MNENIENIEEIEQEETVDNCILEKPIERYECCNSDCATCGFYKPECERRKNLPLEFDPKTGTYRVFPFKKE